MKFITSIALFFITCTYHYAYSQHKESQSFNDSVMVKIQVTKAHYHKMNASSKAKEKITLLKGIGSGYYQINEFDSAAYYYSLGAQQALDSENHELYSSLQYNLSLVYLNKGMYQKALDMALISLETDKLLGHKNEITSSLNSIALIYQEWGIYDKALAYRLESIKLSKEANNALELANSRFNLGSLYVKIGKMNKALSYFSQAKEDYQTLLQQKPTDNQLEKSLSESIYAIGGIYLYNKDFPEALKLFNTALKIKTSVIDNVGMGNCYYQIGLVNFLQNNFEAARQNYFLSLQYKNSVNDQKGIALAYFRIGDLYYNWRKFSESQTFINKSITAAKSIGDWEILKENYRILYLIYSNQQVHKKALNYHELYKLYSDSSSDKNMTNAVEELSIRYETEKKEKKNSILTAENKIKALTIQKQKSMGLYLLIMIILALAIVIVLYVLYQSKRKTNTLITHKNSLLANQNVHIATQKKEIEKKNIRMMHSIQYAQRIQRAMLADVSELNQLVDDAFIYFKPKDIVSGDFYWFAKVDQKLIIAAIDCTGHGVPGAFMSMLGNSFLNQIILNQKITSPDKILEALSNEVQFALRQEETKNKDGMDMALCTIDLKTKQIEFAGAKNPLIIIRDGVAQRIKGDRKPIGSNIYPGKSFEKHQIEVNSPTCIYMFSDGYIDQFGGEKGRKFLIKRLHNLLEEIHHKPMIEQREILNSTLKEWMKNEKQIDDILIVGLKIEL